MPQSGRYPTPASFVEAPWREMWHIVRDMPRLWGSYLVLSAALTFAILYLYSRDGSVFAPDLGSSSLVLSIQPINFLSVALVASTRMAVLRRLLLNENDDHPVWSAAPGLGRYLAWSLLYAVIASLLACIAIGTGASPAILSGLQSYGSLIVLVLLWPWFQLSPALAVGHRGAGFGSALADGRGRYWRYFGASTAAGLRALLLWLCMMPFVAVGVLIIQVTTGWLLGMRMQEWIFVVILPIAIVGSIPIIAFNARVSARFFVEARTAD